MKRGGFEPVSCPQMCNFVSPTFVSGGAGGKGVWGRSGEVYEPEAVDKKDPNYDDAQVTTVGSGTNPNPPVNVRVTEPMPSTGKLRVRDAGPPAG